MIDPENSALTEQDIENWHTIFLSRPRDPRGALEKLIKQKEDEEFMEKLLEAMSTPIDPNSLPPSNLACGLRLEVTRADPETAD